MYLNVLYHDSMRMVSLNNSTTKMIFRGAFFPKVAIFWRQWYLEPPAVEMLPRGHPIDHPKRLISKATEKHNPLCCVSRINFQREADFFNPPHPKKKTKFQGQLVFPTTTINRFYCTLKRRRGALHSIPKIMRSYTRR